MTSRDRPGWRPAGGPSSSAAPQPYQFSAAARRPAAHVARRCAPPGAQPQPRPNHPSRRRPPYPPCVALQGGRSLANPPPFSLQDLRDAIPAECFEKDTFRSFGERLSWGLLGPRRRARAICSAPADHSESQQHGARHGLGAPARPRPSIRAALGTVPSPAPCCPPCAPSSAAYLALDVGVVAALAIAAYYIDNPLVWPLYWFAQGTMFWALFVVGHDAGHQSFSNNKARRGRLAGLRAGAAAAFWHGRSLARSQPDALLASGGV